jgi:hypothetical protein
VIKTKIFYGEYDSEGEDREFIDIDEQINEFLEESRVEYVDVKLTSELIHGEINAIALLIYKE